MDCSRVRPHLDLRLTTATSCLTRSVAFSWPHLNPPMLEERPSAGHSMLTCAGTSSHMGKFHHLSHATSIVLVFYRLLSKTVLDCVLASWTRPPIQVYK